MPISKEERERLIETDGTRDGALRTVRNNIIAMREEFMIDEGDMIACVKDVYKEDA